jgi:hypothetical protein
MVLRCNASSASAATGGRHVWLPEARVVGAASTLPEVASAAAQPVPQLPADGVAVRSPGSGSLSHRSSHTFVPLLAPASRELTSLLRSTQEPGRSSRAGDGASVSFFDLGHESSGPHGVAHVCSVDVGDAVLLFPTTGHSFEAADVTAAAEHVRDCAVCVAAIQLL